MEFNVVESTLVEQKQEEILELIEKDRTYMTPIEKLLVCHNIRRSVL